MGYDVVVAGGGIAGLLCAREIASRGHGVLVAEEGHEVGTPEHCGGLASIAGLDEMGLAHGAGEGGHAIASALVASPSGKEVEIGAARQGVLELDRRGLDKTAARQAARSGAEIRTGAAFRRREGGAATVGREEVGCRIVVDARGAHAAMRRDGSGAIPAAQYEVHADWIRGGRVEVLLDAEKYPGFFAWVIPSARGGGRVGAAGRGINAGAALEALLESRGRFSVTRKVFAPVWVGGPLEAVRGDTVAVGDAAGQAKPTTAGGIFSCGMGGVLAGRAISAYLDSGDRNDLLAYERAWKGRFGAEFGRQLAARRALENLDNAALEGLFAAIAPGLAREVSGSGDFDFHAASIAKLLGIRGVLGAAKAVLGGKIRGAVRPGPARASPPPRRDPGPP